jgi:hypothetical protein
MSPSTILIVYPIRAIHGSKKGIRFSWTISFAYDELNTDSVLVVKSRYCDSLPRRRVESLRFYE